MMDAPAILALDPFRFFLLETSADLVEVEQCCLSHHQGVMVLPSATTTLADLSACLGFGASLILEHSDLRGHSLSAGDRDTLIEEGKERVFLKGYSDGHCLRFLQKGASLLFDGVEHPLSPSTIHQLCRLPHSGHIKVLTYGFSDRDRRLLLKKGIRLVYSWREGQQPWVIDELNKDVAVGKASMVFHLADWPLAQSLDILKKGGTVLITGQTRWSRQQIENELIHRATPEERGRIRMLFRYGPLTLLNDLRQMALIFSLEEVSANVLFN